MAAAVSTTQETFVSNVRSFRRNHRHDEHRAWRLTQTHIQDLRDVARGVEESDVGICCKYLIDSMSGAGSDFEEVSLDDVEQFCQQNDIWKSLPNAKEYVSWRERIQRSRRTLRKMHADGHHKHVAILNVVYGHADPLTQTFPKKVRDSLGDLASLVRYTDIVEVRRQEMARAEATSMVNRPSFATVTRDVPNFFKKLDDEIHEWDDRVQTGDEITRVAIRQNLPVNGAPFLVDVMRHREQYERALRVLTSSDALRSALAVVSDQEKGETSEHYEQRKANVELKRDQFVTLMKIEASKMLEMASLIYYDFWLKSPV